MKRFFVMFMAAFLVLCTLPIPAKGDDSKPVVYLTFDDGPSSAVTPKILDILKEKGVKATFFLIGNRIEGREEVVKRIVNEGNSIGLHTYTHNYKRVYSSEDIFLKEMQETYDAVYNLTNYKAIAIRFPGGSKKHLNRDFANKIHKEGFKIYDWNIPLSDGIKYTTPAKKLYKEGTNRRGLYSPLIILMHCSGENKATCDALPGIIDYYKSRDYEFKIINEDTPDYYFRIK